MATSEEQEVLIPLDTITGQGGAGVIINNGQDESIFVESDMTNPLTVKITAIGGKGNTKWRRGNKYFARYTIEPVEVKILHPTGDTRLIKIDEILLVYRIDNFNRESARDEEGRDALIRFQLPNFITDDEERFYELDNIGDDLIIKEGSQIQIKLADDNTKVRKIGEEEYTRWKNWNLLGGEHGSNVYELQIHDDYALEVKNGDEQSEFKFDSNGLAGLLSKIKFLRYQFSYSSERKKN